MNNTTDSGPSSTHPNPETKTEPRIGLVAVCSIIICILFFCPWIAFLGFSASGFEIVKQGGSGLVLLLIPFAAVFAIIADRTGNQVKTIGCIAGLVPLLLFAYYYSQTGKDIWNLLQPGGYGILGCSIALLVISATSPTKKPTAITFH